MFGSIRNLVESIIMSSVSDSQVRTHSLPAHHEVLRAIEKRISKEAHAATITVLEVVLKYNGDDLDLPLSEVSGGYKIKGPKVIVDGSSPTRLTWKVFRSWTDYLLFIYLSHD